MKDAANEHLYLRMTIDVCVFTEEDAGAGRLAKTLIKEGKTFGVGERLAREFMDKIKKGYIEIDDVSNVENHTEGVSA